MRTQNPPPLKACRFDSDLGHHRFRHLAGTVRAGLPSRVKIRNRLLLAREMSVGRQPLSDLLVFHVETDSTRTCGAIHMLLSCTLTARQPPVGYWDDSRYLLDNGSEAGPPGDSRPPSTWRVAGRRNRRLGFGRTNRCCLFARGLRGTRDRTAGRSRPDTPSRNLSGTVPDTGPWSAGVD